MIAEEIENLLLFGAKDRSDATANRLDSVLTPESFFSARENLRSKTGGPIGPVRIHYTDTAVEWVRRPRSKKKRIRKKWRQKSSNWRPMRGGYVVMGVLYIHPIFRKSLEDELRKPPQFIR
jgi:hypothetical protein